MRGRIGLLSLVLCVAPFTLGGQSGPQMRKPPTREEFQRRAEELRLKIKRDQEEFRRRAEEQRLQQAERHRISEEYRDEAHQEALGATPEQWSKIKPRLETVTTLMGSPPSLTFSVYSVGGGTSYRATSVAGTSHGASSAASASGRSSATGSSDSHSDSSTTGGAGAGHTQAVASGGGGLQVHVPGPVRKQVGDMNLGWLWRRPSLTKDPDTLTEGEKACEQLLDALETDDPDPELVRRQVETLRRVREQRQQELQEARRQLREVVTGQQEAKLILMGLLD